MGDASRFYDVASGDVLRLELAQCGSDFKLLRQFGYKDPRYEEPFLVPSDLKTFTTDLASIPQLFAWLIPGLGAHLPAVLLHDGLVVRPGEDVTHEGPKVGREEADHILRDAMASLGVPKIRRWIMWTAVAIATAWSTSRRTWRWRATIIGTFALLIGLGTVATLDFVDLADVLPWMADRPWPVELLTGGAFAVLIPLAVSRIWGHLWHAGAIAGISVAFLMHVTFAVLVVYGIYQAAEAMLSRSEGSGPNARKSFLETVSRASAAASSQPQNVP